MKNKNLIFSKNRIGSYILTLLTMLILSSCTNLKKDEIDLIEPKQIEDINISTNIKDTNVATLENETFKVFNNFKEQKKLLKTQSVSDTPTNIDEYFILKLVMDDKENPTITFYLYKKDDKYYIEKPYSGIWEIPRESFLDVKKIYNKK